MKVLAQRNLLIQRMRDLSFDNITCKNCPGTCCTFEANSMLITPVEAVDILTYLQSKNLLKEDLRKKLEATIKTYRLAPKFFHERSYLRKTYTCSFFNHQELGCSLPAEVKPFGCLAFNPHHPINKATKDCHSEKDLLEKREAENKEEEEIINKELRDKYRVLWDKAPIPVALIELWDQFSGEGPAPN